MGGFDIERGLEQCDIKAMRALYFDGGPDLRDVPIPEQESNEVLIQMKLAGVCNTDLEILRGYMSFTGILGHEFVGVVVESDDATEIGKRVAADINLACGRCPNCSSGLEHHCPHRTVLGIVGKDGCFAEYLTMPRRNLHFLPESISDDAAAFIEPLAAAFEIPEQVEVANRRSLVIGDGKLGLLCAMVLRDCGSEVHLLGRHDRKLAIAENAGVAISRHASASIGSYDVVVEATGSPSGLATAIEQVRPRGTLVLKSTYHGRVEIDTAPLVIHEITIVGSRCGPFPRAIEALTNRRIDPTPLIDARLPLADGLEALRRAQAPGALKVLMSS